MSHSTSVQQDLTILNCDDLANSIMKGILLDKSHSHQVSSLNKLSSRMTLTSSIKSITNNSETFFKNGLVRGSPNICLFRLINLYRLLLKAKISPINQNNWSSIHQLLSNEPSSQNFDINLMDLCLLKVFHLYFEYRSNE